MSMHQNEIIAEYMHENFYCGICELAHDVSDTTCVRPLRHEDYVLDKYENKHGA